MRATIHRYKIGEQVVYSPDPALVGTRPEHIGDVATVTRQDPNMPYSYDLPPQYQIAFDGSDVTAWAFEDELKPIGTEGDR